MSWAVASAEHGPGTGPARLVRALICISEYNYGTSPEILGGNVDAHVIQNNGVTSVYHIISDTSASLEIFIM